jgi:DNA-binding LytR/AlgR family response regulator
MIKYRVALLDDNKEQLSKNQKILEANNLATVVLACTRSEDFLEKIKTVEAEILFLDLNLGDSYMTGMEVAFELQIPVLFVSSNTAEYIKEIEKLKREYDLCVDHLTKPFTTEEFKKTTQRFLKEVSFFNKEEIVHLDFGNKKNNKIPINSIVFLSSDKQFGSESNNKLIHFNNNKPETLIDFSFTKMEEKGLTKTQFITIHKSLRVNRNHIQGFNSVDETIEVKVVDSNGTLIKKVLKVSDNYISNVKGFKK